MARKREKVANAVLGLAFAAGAAQSPKDFVKTGNVESPGTALMQMYSKKRGEAERNLDSGRVSHPARNRMKKTFKEFMEELVVGPVEPTSQKDASTERARKSKYYRTEISSILRSKAQADAKRVKAISKIRTN
jgi:hypothetical protein